MDEKVIPDIVANFLLEKVESIAELEGLLILHREVGKTWDARVLANRLYVREAQAEQLLRVLCEKGLAVMQADNPPQYAYHAATSEFAAAVDLLARI
jgi:hypothetical protein